MGWKKVKIGDYLTTTELRDPTKRPKSRFKYVDVSSVDNRSFSIRNPVELSGADAPSRARKVIRERDVIFATVRPTLRRVALVDSTLDDQICSTGFCVLRAGPEMDAGFLYFWLLTEPVTEHVAKIEKGVSYPAIRDSDVKAIEMPFPSLAEQRQIARLLSGVQRAIERQERLITLTAELKKALMHHLFTRGTRGEPRKQTEIGRVPGSWQIKQIAEVCKLVSGGTPSKSNPAFWNGSIPWVSPKDMKQSRLHDSEDHISQAGQDDGSRLAPAGSIFVVIRGMILMRDVPIAQALVPMAFNQDMKALVEHRGISSDFLLYSLQHARERILRKVGSSAHGTRTLMTRAIEELPISVPNNHEQEIISEVLRLTDLKESIHKRTAAQLRELFRTLLHQLMTAQIRVHDIDLSALDTESAAATATASGGA